VGEYVVLWRFCGLALFLGFLGCWEGLYLAVVFLVWGGFGGYSVVGGVFGVFVFLLYW